MTEWNPQANKIMLAALEIGELDERADFVESACAGNTTLRAKVDALLQAHEKAAEFFGTSEETTSSPSDQQHLVFPVGTELAGRYVIRRGLGEGGMGVVLLADQTHPVKREVAIKLIKSGLDAREALLRFDQERNALAMMDHPHIAKVFDAGVVDRADGSEIRSDVESTRLGGIPYFAMEYIPGIPITDYCDRRQLDLRSRLKLFINVCQAVQHAHQKGVVHRDLKPSNILVDNVDNKHVCKVIDFGVAKVIGVKLTEQTLQTSIGSVVGTLDYMSPEQASFSHDIDTRSDVYALGAVLHELLVGCVPHESLALQQAGLDEMLRVIKEDSPPPPSSRLSTSARLPSIAADRGVVPGLLLRTIRGDLDLILLKALEKDRDRRYDSINMLAEDIQRHLDEEPIVARPPSAKYRLHKAYRRHRGAFWAAGTALGLLILGVFGTSVGFVAASRNERVAKNAAQRATTAEQQVRDTLQEVQQQRDEAERQKKIADSISDFLLYDLISQANVAYQANRLHQAGGKAATETVTRNPTLLQLVDRAADALQPVIIEKRFPNQPIVQAMLLRQIGYVYSSMGESDKAIELLQRATTMLDATLGANSSETMAALKHLGGALQMAGRYEEALTIRKERLKRCQQFYGPTDERTVLAMLQLSSAHQSAGEFEQGLEVAKRAAAICDNGVELRYSDDLEELKSQVDEAVAQQSLKLGQFRQAGEMLESVVSYRQQHLGEQHPFTARAKMHLASVYLYLMQFDKARGLYEEVVPQLQQLHGTDHPVPLSVIHNLGMCYQRMGEQQDAITTFERLIERYTRREGPESVNTLRVTANLGVSFWLAGRREEAIEKLQSAHQHEQAPAWVVERLNRVLLSDGQPAEAERAVKARLDQIRKHHPDGAKQLAAPLFALAFNLITQERYDDAEGPLRELDSVNAQHKIETWKSFAAKSMLGKVLMERDQMDEAQSWLIAGFEGLQSQSDRILRYDKHHLVATAGWLAEFYGKQNDTEAEERWRQEHSQLKAEIGSPTEL